MPERTTPTSKIQTTPCGNPNRSPLDVAGRINDLINCYLLTASEAIRVYLPLVVIGLILLVIMLLAAREVLKG